MVYVDEAIHFFKNKKWCHMFSDEGLDELHSFAEKIGLKRDWFQNNPLHPHYDLSPGKRDEAVKNGATEVRADELVRIIWKWRNTQRIENSLC